MLHILLLKEYAFMLFLRYVEISFIDITCVFVVLYHNFKTLERRGKEIRTVSKWNKNKFSL